MKKHNQLRGGVLLSYCNLALGSIVPLLYTPVMLRLLGQTEYGLYSLAGSVIGYLSLLNFGLGSTIIRYLSKYRAEKNKSMVERTMGLFILLYCALAALLLLGGWILSNNIESIFSRGLTAQELETMKLLVRIMAFNTAISFPISVFSSIITAYEKYIYLQCVNIVSTVLMPCANLLALYLGFGSVGMCLTSTLFQFLLLPVYGLYSMRVLCVHPRFSSVPTGLLREIVRFSLFVFLGSIVDILFWTTDKVILGMLTSTAVVAVYNIGASFNAMMTQMSTALSGVLMPKVTKMAATDGTPAQFTQLFIRVGRLQYLIISLVLSGFLVFGRQFIVLWVGANYSDAYWIALVTLVPLAIPLIQNTGISIVMAQNRHQFRSTVYLIIAVINVCATWLVVPYVGGIGAAICSGGSYLIGQGIIMNLYYDKVVGIDIPRFWKNIAKLSLVPGVLLAAGLLLTRMAVISSWMRLLAAIVLYTILFCLGSYCFSMNEYEKTIVRGLFHRLRSAGKGRRA